MRVLYLYCHPLADSYHGALRTEALAALNGAGHEIDHCDLYAENFEPVLTAQMRRNYHDTALNRQGLEPHVARLQRAEALIVQFPTWCFGMPAMLKGYFDRLIMPGVAFDLSNPADVKPMLHNLKVIHGIVTYGRPRHQAIYMGDPPRKAVTRYLPWFTGGAAKVKYHALYHMNVATEFEREMFLARVRGEMLKLA
jgi:putative NADPH-quinone reductase